MRMNELGILVDLSHCGQRTTADGIQTSKKPVAITHAGCSALVPLPRNKRDEELRLLAERGGVVGIYFMPFLREQGQPMAEDVIRHVEHALNVCGEEHVGVGTDLPISPLELTADAIMRHRQELEERRRAGISAPGESPDVFLYVRDLNAPRRLAQLADLLLARGHSTSRVEKILGGNFLRLFGEAWR